MALMFSSKARFIGCKTVSVLAYFLFILNRNSVRLRSSLPV